MQNSYLMAEVMRNRRKSVHLFEVEDGETLEDVVLRNFGPETSIVRHRIPTKEEFILMRRGMKS